MRIEYKPRNFSRRAVLVILLGIVIGGTGFSPAKAEKTKLAVLSFETQGRFEVAPDVSVSRTLADWLTLALVQNGRFQVVERHLIDKILKAHQVQVSASGTVDGRSASHIGTLLGVDAVITGRVVRLANRVDLNLRVIDVRTAAIHAAENIQTTSWDQLKKGLPNLVLNISAWFPVTGSVVSRKAQEVVLDVGRQSGVKAKMTFNVNRLGNPIYHPKTGRKLGVEETPVGEIQVSRVDDQIAYAQIVSESSSQQISIGDRVEGRLEKSVPADLSVLPYFPKKRVAGKNAVTLSPSIPLTLFMTVISDLKKTRLSASQISSLLTSSNYWSRIQSDLSPRKGVPAKWASQMGTPLDQALDWLAAAIEANPELHPKAVAAGLIPYRQNRVGMEFVYIPAGQFKMGSPVSEAQRENDEIQQPATLSAPFYMMNTEVTQEHWRRVMGNRPSFFGQCGPDCPVEQVAWDEIQHFLKRLNIMTATGAEDAYVLPHEVQWEYACRAGTQTVFSDGDCLDDRQANFDGGYPYAGCSSGAFLAQPVAVSQYGPNRWGIFDLHGNVMEWCHNHPQDRSILPVAGGQKASSLDKELRSVKGGSWYNGAGKARCAARLRFRSAFRNNQLGFRVIRKIAP